MIIHIGFLGDIVGRSGRNFVKSNINFIKQQYNLDLLIANGENASGGTGLGENEAKDLKNAGIDLITLGDHCFSNSSIFPLLNSKKNDFCIMPANLVNKKDGREYLIYDYNGVKIVVFNLLGKVFISQDVSDPFETSKKILEKIYDEIIPDIILLDFHAEATSEKQAMGFFLDSKVSVVVGTHTHVQTADEKILKGGTAYITDVGMCGPRDGVIGMDTNWSLDRLMGIKEKGYKLSSSKCFISGVVISIESKTGKAVDIKRFQLFED